MKIQTMMGVAAAAAAVAAIAAVAPARAAEINPSSYTFSAATDCGTFCYHDSTGAELTDGVLGNAGWGNPPEPWVAWTEPSVNIDFDFGALIKFAKVSVGTTQDNVRDVVLPSLELFSSNDGLSWTSRASLSVPADSANDVDYLSGAPHGFLALDGLNFTSRYVRLSATNMGLVPNTFIFLDEVDFDGVRVTGSPTPEPSSWAIMLVGFFGLGLMLRASRPAWSA